MNICKAVSYVALAATVVPCLLFLAGTIDHAAVKYVALAGTLVWFGSAPMWIGKSADKNLAEE
ncbi:MAG: hypothetical protein RH917_17085 [Lacipirellulaceae bacterium]